MAAKQARPNPPFTTEGMPTPAGRREPIGIDRPSIRQCRNTLCLFRVGVSGRSRQEKPTKAGSESPESKKNDFVKSRLMSDSSAGRLDPNQPVHGGRGDHPKSQVPAPGRYQTRTVSRSLEGFGAVGRRSRPWVCLRKRDAFRVRPLASPTSGTRIDSGKNPRIKNEQSRRASPTRHFRLAPDVAR